MITITMYYSLKNFQHSFVTILAMNLSLLIRIKDLIRVLRALWLHYVADCCPPQAIRCACVDMALDLLGLLAHPLHSITYGFEQLTSPLS
jgi:hypothetical protein